MWSGLFADLAAEHGAALYLNSRNCRPISDSDFCGPQVQQAVLDFIASAHITDAVLAATWHGFPGTPDAESDRELAGVVGKLSSAGVLVWIVVDTPSGAPFDPIVAYERNPQAPQFGVVAVRDYVVAHHRQASLVGSMVAAHRNVRAIDPSLDLCGETTCAGGEGTSPWYRDGGHLTDRGALVAREQFLPLFAGSNARRTRRTDDDNAGD